MTPAACEDFPFGAVLDGLEVVQGIWSQAERGQYCGVSLVPTATTGFGANVRAELPPGRCWGWFQPGDLRAAHRFGRDLIADIELRGTNHVVAGAGWTGKEVEEAAAAAELVGGVTSHGYVLKQLRPVLREFATRGLPAYPMVFDSDQSAEPRAFLRKCVAQYRALGFAEVRPLLGLSAGAGHLAVWLDECRREGWKPDLWSLARARAMKLCSGRVIEVKTEPESHLPSLPPPPRRVAASDGAGGGVLLLVAAGLLYVATRNA